MNTGLWANLRPVGRPGHWLVPVVWPFSSEALLVSERDRTGLVRGLVPSICVHRLEEQPQAQCALSDRWRDLDPGNQVRGEFWCEDIEEAVHQVGHAVDRQEDSDDPRQEVRLDH